MADAETNKRRKPRVFVQVVIESVDNDTVKLLLDYPDSESYLYDYSTNLSEGGIFLKTTETLPVGTVISMRFTIPDDINLLEATGVVKWITTEEDARLHHIDPGIGIEFTHITEDTKRRIRSFINGAP